MAEFILPQTESFCKVQNNPKLKSVSDLYKSNADKYFQMSGKILAMDNDSAVEFLKANGFFQIVPGTHFAPCCDFAEFFGVNPDSLYNYLYRHNLSGGGSQKESIYGSFAAFVRKAGLLKVGQFVDPLHAPDRGYHDFRFNNTGVHYITKYSSSTRMYSARLALSMVPFIYRWNIKFDKGHKIVSVYNALVKLIEEDEVAEAISPAIPANSSTVISKDELMAMIKQAVREVLADTKVEVPAMVTITT